MSDDLRKVCCIMDFEGFAFRNYTADKTFKREFLIREIGFIKIDPAFGDFLARSFRFDLTFFDFTHCRDAWNTITFQSRHVSGLSFKPLPDEKVYPYEQVNACIETIYEMCRTPERDVVAFKGGDFEREILDKLNIKNLDLSVFGCPKFEKLLSSDIIFSYLRNCGFHRRLADSDRPVHCPMTEVTAFKDWLLYQHPYAFRSASDGNRDLCGSTAGSLLPLSPAASSSALSSSSDCS